MAEEEWKPPRRFAHRLVEWSEGLDRPLPWRNEQDPYRVWLSEVMTQQTRAETAIRYYRDFLRAWPTVHDLADAPLEQVLKAWEGLGYYNRARHAHQAARLVSRTLGGVFPSSVAELQSLPGIGPYASAAIAAFAFGRREVAVDGNVVRVISRLAGWHQPVSLDRIRSLVRQAGPGWIGREDPGRFNQAFMDFGARQCKPRGPDCANCPFNGECLAFADDAVPQIPARSSKPPLRDRYFLLVECHRGRNTWLIRRGMADIWHQMYTFPMHECPTSDQLADPRLWVQVLHGWFGPSGWSVPESVSTRIQVLSHQRIHARFIRVNLDRHARIPEDWIVDSGSNFTTFALPKIMREHLDSRSSYLPTKRKKP